MIRDYGPLCQVWHYGIEEVICVQKLENVCLVLVTWIVKYIERSSYLISNLACDSRNLPCCHLWFEQV